MIESLVIYNILINLDECDMVLNKLSSYITNENVLKKIFLLYNDVLIVKNKIYKYIYDGKSDKINLLTLKEKYNEYKNIMPFL